MPYTATRDLFLNADKTKVVEEDDPEAAYLLVNKGRTLQDKEYAGLDMPRSGSATTAYDAKADHEAKHRGETNAEAKRKRAAMFDPNRDDDPDGPPAEGERSGVKAAKQPPETKAVTRAPSDKSG